jgi:hypothetical protein
MWNSGISRRRYMQMLGVGAAAAAPSPVGLAAQTTILSG